MFRRTQILVSALLLLTASFAGVAWHLDARFRAEVAQSVGSWEEDLIRASAPGGRPDLLLKIAGLLKEQGAHLVSVEGSFAAPSAGLLREKGLLAPDACGNPFDVPVSLYGVSGGKIRFCRPLAHLWAETALSSPFLGSVILGLLLIGLFSRESWKIRVERTRLLARVHIQEEMARVTRQVAHDIRGPLSALQVVAGLVHDLGEERARLLQSAVSRIQKISGELLLEGKIVLPGSVEISRLAPISSDVGREVASRFPRQRLQARAESVLTGSIGLRGEAWARIAQNLLQNAFEANELSGGEEVLLAVDSAAGALRLRVFDRGTGFPAEALRRLGEEGFSLDKANGSGFGLFYVKSQVEAVGGTLAARPREGGGSVVEIILPLHQSQSRVPSQGTA